MKSTNKQTNKQTSLSERCSPAKKFIPIMIFFSLIYFGLSSTVKSQEFCSTPAESTNRGMVEYFNMYGIDYSAYYFCVKISGRNLFPPFL